MINNANLTKVQQGTHATLNEGDIWDLSPTMQSRPIFIKFATVQSVSFN